jgi:hypothetical protein
MLPFLLSIDLVIVLNSGRDREPSCDVIDRLSGRFWVALLGLRIIGRID